MQNGKSLGRKAGGHARNFTTHFTSQYDAGTITALAYSREKVVQRSSLKAAGAITLKARAGSEGSLVADAQSLSYLDIELSDAEGIVEMLDDDVLTVEVEGPASLIGFGNAALSTLERYDDNVHSTYRGRAQAVIRSEKIPGQIEVTVKSEKHGTATVQLNQIAV